MAAALAAAGCRALVVSRGGRLVSELERVGAEHIELPVHSKNPVVMGLNVERLTRLIERQSVDIVHARSRAP
ncbi:MAG: glycosyltransferase, partial [Rhodobiaceae bacterium]|nr:glycosyltransferase [Rhodobiaceae bacterium]